MPHARSLLPCLDPRIKRRACTGSRARKALCMLVLANDGKENICQYLPDGQVHDLLPERGTCKLCARLVVGTCIKLLVAAPIL